MPVNKDIQVLSDFEHVLRKPTIYVGSVEPSEERVPVIKDNLIYEDVKIISVGMYKILNESIDNAFDEAKRQGGSGIKIHVSFDSGTNMASISDSGGGFRNAEKIHKKTNLSMVETALTILRAGSNFENDSLQENIVGTNGMGISLTNMLSETFSVVTNNGTVQYEQTWENFRSIKKNHRAAKRNEKTGTTISFIPRKDIFKKCFWDREFIQTQMSFRKWILGFDPILQDVEFSVSWDGIPMLLVEDFFPQNKIMVSTKIGTICLYPSFSGSIRTSFINGTQASSTGQRQIHEAMVHEELNSLLGYEQANQFYETVITLNVPPKIMRFGDQNKTRFVTTRAELQPFLEQLTKKLRRNVAGSELEETLKKAINEHLHKGEIKKMRVARKDNSIKFSEKYFPASKKKERIFLCEGLSAAGSLAQKRNKETDAVYALRGKVKNVQTITDMTSNKEIMDLINILGLDIENQTLDFKEVIIATDADFDGQHITSLLINLFYRWFPYVIQKKKLATLMKPLVSCEIDGRRERKYFYSLKEFEKYSATSQKKPKNVRYLKGLGSNDIKDWEWIFNNMQVMYFREDTQSMRFLDIAFGTSAQKRKDWLQTIPSSSEK